MNCRAKCGLTNTWEWAEEVLDHYHLEKDVMNYVTNTVLRVRNFLFGSVRKSRPTAEVIVHDPAADKAQNLDDPFLDLETQRRIGKLIGGSSIQRKSP